MALEILFSFFHLRSSSGYEHLTKILIKLFETFKKKKRKKKGAHSVSSTKEPVDFHSTILDVPTEWMERSRSLELQRHVRSTDIPSVPSYWESPTRNPFSPSHSFHSPFMLLCFSFLFCVAHFSFFLVTSFHSDVVAAAWYEFHRNTPRFSIGRSAHARSVINLRSLAK